MERDDFPNSKITDYYQFYSDWNWVMAVITKIVNINRFNSTGQRFRFNSNRCAKYNMNDQDKPYKIRINGVLITEPRPNISIDSFDELQGTYQAIVEFITWYNSNYTKLDII